MKRERCWGEGTAAAERPDPWQAALKLLAMRAMSTEELRRHLLRRRYTKDQIGAVLARLTSSRYLDDLEYARAWARARADHRSMGPMRLARELRARGIAEREIADAVDGAFADREMRDVADAAVKRKLRGLRGLAPVVARRRLAAHLTRQGFPADIILALCRKYLPGVDASEDD